MTMIRNCEKGVVAFPKRVRRTGPGDQSGLATAGNGDGIGLIATTVRLETPEHSSRWSDLVCEWPESNTRRDVGPDGRN
jgi:hypothetical protein